MNDLDVKKLRENNSMTQAELAKMMVTSIQTIKNWEAGKNIPSTARAKLMEIFHLNESGEEIKNENTDSSGSVIDALTHQLDEKDRQIDRLLGIIEKISSK